MSFSTDSSGSSSGTPTGMTDVAPTNDTSITTGSGTGDGTTGDMATGGTGISNSGTTADDGTTSTPSSCGPPCPETWELLDTLDLDELDDFSKFACLTRVSGDLKLQGDITTEQLGAFASLREVGGALKLVSIPGLKDLSYFACLQRVDFLSVNDAPALTDLTALTGLKTTFDLSLIATGLTALPPFAPDFGPLSSVHLQGNPALVDIDAMASWNSGDVKLTVRLIDNAMLSSAIPLAKLLAQPRGGIVNVQLSDLPALTSLAGLEPLSDPLQKVGSLHLGALPLVSDLEAISSLKTAFGLTLAGMPKVTFLGPLSDLETVDYLNIGDCSNADGEEGGMDGLTSLSGLDNLVDVFRLGIAGNMQLASLAGAPMLQHVDEVQIVGNPVLSQAAVDEFLAQLDQPSLLCVGDSDECPCFD